MFTHLSFTNKEGQGWTFNKTKENLTASGKILVFWFAGERWVMWSKSEQLSLNDHKASESKHKKPLRFGGKRKVYSIPPYSSKPPASGQETCPKIWQPADVHYYCSTLFLIIHYWIQHNIKNKTKKNIHVERARERDMLKSYKDLKSAGNYNLNGNEYEITHYKIENIFFF